MNILVNCMSRRHSSEIFSYEMTKGLLNNDCSVYAIIPDCIENLEQWKLLPLKKLFIITTYTDIKSFVINTAKLFVGKYASIKKMFNNIKIDIVYVPMINIWTGIINNMFPDSKIFITLHDPIAHTGSSKIRTYIEEKTARRANYIILLSNNFKKHIEQKYSLLPKQVIIIPHGNYRHYKNVEMENTESVCYDSTKINFLYFGRIEKYKGLHILAKAYKMLCNEYSEQITLTVAGSGIFEEYRKEFSELPNVRVVNRWIPDEEVGAFFSGENIIVVLPYIDASQSGVIPIAMEYRKLIIASDTGGLNEQVQDGVTGILVKPNDAEELYIKMKYCIMNRKQTNILIENAERYLKSLNWDILAERLKQHFENA